MSDDSYIRQYVVRGGLWASIGLILTGLMGLFQSATLARLLTPEDMGIYFLAFNLATFFAIIGRMGMDKTLLRFISEALGLNQIYNVRIIVVKGLQLGLLSSTIVASVVYIAAGPWIAKNVFSSNALDEVSGFIAIWLILLAFQLLMGEIYRAFRKIGLAMLFGGLISSAGTALITFVYLLVRGHATLQEILPFVLAAGLLNIILAGFVLAKLLPQAQPSDKETYTTFSKLSVHSWPLLINAATMFIVSQSDLWVLSTVHSAEEVAIYGAASLLVLLTGMPLTIVNAVVPPLIANLNVLGDTKSMELILRTAATLSAIPSIIILSIYMFFSEWLLTYIFGEYYKPGGVILSILCVGQFVNVLVGSCGNTLILTGHRHTIMVVSLVSAGIALISSLLLVKTHGAIGVAFGYMISRVVQQIALLLFVRLHCGIWTHAGFRYFKHFSSLLKYNG